MAKRDKIFESRAIFDRVVDGDDEAAKELFDAYVCRLVALTRSRLSEKLRQRVDAEDIVQSAFRSFFVRAQAGQYAIGRGGDLWRLLASITRNKVLKKAEHHRQQRRALTREEAEAGLVQQAANEAQTPTDFEAIVLADEVELVMRRLDAPRQQVLQMRLQGQNVAEIAAALDRSERTIRRYLDDLLQTLETRLLEKCRLN